MIDVCATTDLMDAYVLVIEWGRTSIDLVEHALRAAPNVKSLLGAVLNKADIRRLGKYNPCRGATTMGNNLNGMYTKIFNRNVRSEAVS